MKFDPECAKAVLQAYEDLPIKNNSFDLGITQYSPEVLYFHQLLLKDAGYILCKDCSTLDSYDILPIRITMTGVEFLEASKNRDAWTAVRKLSAKTGGFVMSITADILNEYVKNQIMNQIL